MLRYYKPLTEFQNKIYIKHLFPELAQKSFRIPLESYLINILIYLKNYLIEINNSSIC